MRVLIVGKIWPEPTSSAAGTRTHDLIRALVSRNWELHFACSAQTSPYSSQLSELFPVQTHEIELNSSSFDLWVQALGPDIVIFDRYMTEEQFGWRVAQSCPNALRVIDTSDLHCLREARHQSLKTGQPINLQNETALREIAAILRSDLSLIISETEMEILSKHFHVPQNSIAYWPFALPRPQQDSPTFSEREHFVMIGSFLHEPNWDAVRFCNEAIWPKIREKLPEAQLHVYGSYPPPKAQQLHNESKGFHVLGRAKNAIETLSRYRLNLAPLRFGAGLKGKIVDAFLAGTPSIATPIAVEGMGNNTDWSSQVSDDPLQFANEASRLYQDQIAWSQAQANGYQIAETRFAESEWLPRLPEILEKAQANREENRKRNFVGQLLNHHHHRSTEFMSRWIEAKNRNQPHSP
ncbi:glycosyltransferase family 4 protein [Pelagicoccus mobilis]|uniref:Glycosyltransferase family 4 protein n=1 Tax=Pelagicoccus mobilis TaxID=415221 RepID=A0A934RXE5_9BACT|nr:glycosyltransferase family 4 protein [Pelagicoccus mobilis]MBK1878083.1 glycosyltransferase family 4 protein [Pelagicoccus mobilis]